MAIVHVNGFGTVPTSGDYVGLVNATTGISTWSRQAGRYGGYSLRHTNSLVGSGSGNYIGKLTFPITLVNNQCSLGFALNHRSAFTASTSSQFGISWGGTDIWFGTGTGNVYGSGTGSSAWSTLDGTPTGVGWHWWNIVTLYSGTTGYTRVYRDGVLLAQQQPDTAWGGGLATNFTFFLGNSNGSAQVDIGDLVIRDDTTLIPDSVVSSLFPDSTTANDWVGSDGDSNNNHQLINENPTYDSATYVGSGTLNATDTYTLSNLPNTASSVHAVQVGVRAFKNDAGARTMQTLVNSQAGTAIDPGGGTTVYQIATTSDGSTPWNTSSVNAATASIRVAN